MKAIIGVVIERAFFSLLHLASAMARTDFIRAKRCASSSALPPAAATTHTHARSLATWANISPAIRS